MRIAVIGDTGLIASRVVAGLSSHGHETLAASPATGVDTLTGEGLLDALAGASVVVDVSSSPWFDDAAVLEFFTTSTRNLLIAEEAEGVGHHVTLSAVGTERLAESGHFRAKIAQEELIRASGIPYSIVHTTPFFEFVTGIAEAATEGDTIRVAPALVLPIAADDVAAALVRIALGPPTEGVVEVAGPEQFRLDVFIDRWLQARNDPRVVVSDRYARYFDALLDERTLLPGFNATIGETRLADWLARSATGSRAGALFAGPVRA
jgi:uncharacterized protein YbjT (DUF2867 family)